MRSLKGIVIEMVLPLIVAWFLMTVLVDIVVIPNVFRNVSNLADGGKIGMVIFSRFNSIEVAMALLICIGLFLLEKTPKVLLASAVVLLALSFFYQFYMTPMITNLGTLIHQLNETDPQFLVLLKKHRSYHVMYRYLDSAKLVLLFIFAGMLLRLKLRGPLKESI